jgi:hypothetical protein
MFCNIKNQIKELAKNGVLIAESELGSGKGEQKKKMAIDYVVNNLKCSDFLKSIVRILLSGFIDKVIEVSVSYMNSLIYTEGEKTNGKQ